MAVLVLRIFFKNDTLINIINSPKYAIAFSIVTGYNFISGILCRRLCHSRGNILGLLFFCGFSK